MNNLRIEIDKLDHLYENSFQGLFAIGAIVFIVGYAFYGHVAFENLALWSVLNLATIALRAAVLYLYNKTTIDEQNVKTLYYRFFLLSTLSAFFLGSGAFYILPDSFEYQMIFIMALSFLISGASVSLTSRLEIYYGYVLLVVLPILIFLFNESSFVGNVIAFALLVYIVVLFSLGKKINAFMTNNFELLYSVEQKAQEANDANRAKSEFLSVMSHEIRTPLNAIMGFVQILLRSEKDAKKLKYLNTINNSSKTLTNTINDILDITKIESGNLKIEPVEFDPAKEFQMLYSLFKPNAKEKGVLFINSISSELPPFIKSDMLRLKQVVSNLLSNAIKFTPASKSVELIVKYNEATQKLSVSVKDEGIGISQENISKVTEAFVQADSSTARAYGGTGLGLSIVTKLLKLLGSTLSIESKLGEGSRFSFELSVEVVKQEIVEEEKNSSADFQGKTILVAEDNEMNSMLIKLLLEEMNIEVTMSVDGLEAQKKFEEEDFDLVLMDINMPNKNGTEAMLAIKEYEHSKGDKTPIVALTANAVSGDEAKYLEQGFDAYLKKPIELESLVSVLQHYLK